MTDLRTEIAGIINTSSHKYNADCADEIIALINKRWQDWLTARGATVEMMYEPFNCDALVVEKTLYLPSEDDPNRYCPMSKEG